LTYTDPTKVIAELDGPLLKTLYAERRLPFRYMRLISKYFGWINRFAINTFIFRKIRKAARVIVNPNAETEVHSLVRHRDVDMYLIAVKSLLRFYSNLALVIHNDGTLTPADKRLMRDHIVGAVIIDREEADSKVNQELKGRPECRDFRNRWIDSLQLFDYSILSSKRKLISLDSDVIFIREPTELVEWITTENSDVIYNQEAEGTKMGRTLWDLNISCNGELNAGFVGYYKDMIDYDLVEEYIPILRDKHRFGTAQVYMGLCLHRAPYRPRALQTEKYLIYMGHGKRALEKAKMVHFLSFLRFAQLHYPRLALRLVRELSRDRE
jgi:hypothetical protein